MSTIVSPNILTDGLVLYLDAGNRKSYSGGGTIWYDLSGRNNNSTLFNGPSFSALNMGCFSLDGVNDYFSFGQTNFSGNNPWSATFWVRVNQSEVGGGRKGWFLWLGDDIQSGNNLIAFGVRDGFLEVAHWANDNTYNNTPINFNNYQNLTITFDGVVENIYNNGVLTDNKLMTLNIINGNWYIGSRVGSSEFLAFNLVNVQLYSKALSANEVSQNYNATKSRFGL